EDALKRVKLLQLRLSPVFNTANGTLSHIHCHAAVSAYVADLILNLVSDTTEHIGHEGELFLKQVRSLGTPVSAATASAAVAAAFTASAARRHGWRGGHSPVNVVRVVACACVEAVGATTITDNSAILNLAGKAWAITQLHGAWVGVCNIVSQT